MPDPIDWADVMALRVMAETPGSIPDGLTAVSWARLLVETQGFASDQHSSIAAALREAYEAGCKHGFDDGRREATEDYEGGYKDGYDEGFADAEREYDA